MTRSEYSVSRDSATRDSRATSLLQAPLVILRPALLASLRPALPVILRPALLAITILALIAPSGALAQSDQSGAEAAPDTSWVFELSPRELFLRASSSALQFQHMIAPSRRRLVADHEASLPYLVTRLDTDDARERHALEDILVRIGEPAVEPVIEAFENEVERPDTTRGARLAASVLGRLASDAAVGPLSDARHHDDWKVRGAVAGALGRIGVEEAVPALVDLLDDENETVRKSAAFGLGRTASKTREACDCEEAISVRKWSPALDALAEAMDDPYYAVRYNAASALARIGDPALPALSEAARSGSETSRLMALWALGEMSSGDSVSVIEDLLRSKSWVVRAYAAEAAGKLETSGRLRRTLERMRDEEQHPFVQFRIDEALASE
jgi:HEAT repeat protein